jgi:hypothetical protein
MTRRRPIVVQLTTTDISFDPLLGPELEAFVEIGFDVVVTSGPGPYVEARSS